jgi:hypothetical protein
MKRIDMTGQRYGRLLVLRCAGKDQHGILLWLCQCDCGNEKIAYRTNLRSGDTRSCGCLQREVAAVRHRIHGHAFGGNRRSRTYITWQGLRPRCYDPTHPSFKYYGARGISVCARWFNFKNFLSDMGERPDGKTLDRTNNDDHYMPSNCRWLTPKEQAVKRNK